jgi:hypothetical protein
MEKISTYRPHSMLINEMVKMTNTRTPARILVAEYWEISNPARRDIARNETRKKNERKVTKSHV